MCLGLSLCRSRGWRRSRGRRTRRAGVSYVGGFIVYYIVRVGFCVPACLKTSNSAGLLRGPSIHRSRFGRWLTIRGRWINNPYGIDARLLVNYTEVTQPDGLVNGKLPWDADDVNPFGELIDCNERNDRARLFWCAVRTRPDNEKLGPRVHVAVSDGHRLLLDPFVEVKPAGQSRLIRSTEASEKRR